MSRFSKWIAAVLLLVAVGLAGTQLLLIRHPQFQRLKNRVLPFLIVDPRLEIPNTSVSDVDDRIAYADGEDVRHSFRDQLELLIVTTHYQLDEHSPGGLLLDVRFSRRGNLFGRYSSYDPVRLQKHVESIKRIGAQRNQRILIYDEGEGGYVMRTGKLPPAHDIGQYLYEGHVAPTLEGRVAPARSVTERERQVEVLFATYADELVRQGVDVVLAPVLDVTGATQGARGRTPDDRTFSDDYVELERLARMYVEAMQSRNLLVVAKHFLTLRFVDELDPHDRYVVNMGSPEDFKQASQLYAHLKDELDGVMLSHIGDPRDGGLPGTISAVTVSTLVDSLGFDGLVLTDELHMSGITDFVRTMSMTSRQQRIAGDVDDPVLRAAILAFDAGVHQVLISKSWSMDDLLDAIETRYYRDSLFAGRIDTALGKVRAFREKRGVYN